MDPNTVDQLLGLGWGRQHIWDIHQFALQHDLPATRCGGQLMLGNRYMVYRDEDLTALGRVVSSIHAPFTAYTDGSGTVADLPAGIGVVVRCGGVLQTQVSRYIGLGTNNTAELAAIWQALKEVPDLNAHLTIYSDSQYGIGVLTQPGWKLKKNINLIEAIRQDLSFRHNITFQHVAGHAGIPDNEMADQLARAGRQQGATIPRDYWQPFSL